jgi:hypothetical protein
MATERERQHLNDVMSLSDALEAALQSWMTREEKRPADAAVSGGLAEFTARTLLRCLPEIPPAQRVEWMAAWMTLLTTRLQLDR